MLKRIKTNGKAFVLVFDVEASKPVCLKIEGSCADHQNTRFFDMDYGKEGFKGKKTFEINLPFSPRVLNISITTKKGSMKNVKVSNFKSKSLPFDLSKLDSETKSFLRFCKEFVMQCGYISPNTIQSEEHIIVLSDEIREKNTNKIIDTPARVGMTSGIIEIAKNSFDNLTVAQRMFILCHEKGHFKLQTADEETADKFAIMCFKSLCFPPLEAVYSFTRVFRFDNVNNPEVENRVKELIERLKKYYA